MGTTGPAEAADLTNAAGDVSDTTRQPKLSQHLQVEYCGLGTFEFKGNSEFGQSLPDESGTRESSLHRTGATGGGMLGPSG